MMGKKPRRPSPLHDPVYEQLRKRLKVMRLKAEVTQEKLGADAFKRPHTFVHKVEAGDRRVDPVEFCRWCAACGVDPADEILRIARSIHRHPPL